MTRRIFPEGATHHFFVKPGPLAYVHPSQCPEILLQWPPSSAEVFNV
jgi:hypothetical protein